MSHHQLVIERQEPLRKRYRTDPGKAAIVDGGESSGGGHHDPFHGLVRARTEGGEAWRVGIHGAVGGFHDLPNPGDLLCTALAACLDTTLRILAARLQVPLAATRVVVRGEIDVRGTLAVSDVVPVGFQKLRCSVELAGAAGVPQAAVERLLRAAERACVVLQTLRHGVDVELSLGGEGSRRLAQEAAGGAMPGPS